LRRGEKTFWTRGRKNFKKTKKPLQKKVSRGRAELWGGGEGKKGNRPERDRGGKAWGGKEWTLKKKKEMGRSCGKGHLLVGFALKKALNSTVNQREESQEKYDNYKTEVCGLGEYVTVEM